MIASERIHQNLSNYKQFLLKKRFVMNKKQNFSCEIMRDSDNCIYDYAQSVFGEDFNPIDITGRSIDQNVITSNVVGRDKTMNEHQIVFHISFFINNFIFTINTLLYHKIINQNVIIDDVPRREYIYVNIYIHIYIYI